MGQRHLGFGAEVTYGTGVIATDFVNLLTEDFKLGRETENFAVLDTWAPPIICELTSAVRGSCEIWGNFETPGLLFKHLYGDVLTSGADPFVHTFPVVAGLGAGRAGKSLTASVRKDGTLHTRYEGLKVVGYSVTSAFDRTGRMTWNFVGEDADTTQAPDTEVLPATGPFPIRHSDLSLTIDASAIDCVSVEINVEWPVDEPYDSEGGIIFGAEPIDVGEFAVSGSIEARYVTTAEYLKVQSFADVDIAIAWDNATESLTHNVDKAKLVEGEASVNQRDRVLATYEFVAQHNTAATTAMQTVLVNHDTAIP